MGELKSKMVNHVRSAQKWLNRAEQAFESQQDMRGKLDLMLAQAEMQHLHESVIKGKKFSLIKQAVAFSLAAVLFSGGIGGAYFYFHQGVLKQDQEFQMADHQLSLPLSTPQVSLAPIFSSPTTASSVIAGATVPSALQPTVIPAQQEENVSEATPVAADRKAANPQVVSPEEMQKLIRAAGKSLRGQ